MLQLEVSYGGVPGALQLNGLNHRRQQAFEAAATLRADALPLL